MGKENKLGTVTGESKGFTIRQQLKNNKHTGKFEICAGKKIVQEINSTKEGLELIENQEFVTNWRKKKDSNRYK